MRFFIGAVILLAAAIAARANPPEGTLVEVAQARARALLMLQKVCRQGCSDTRCGHDPDMHVRLVKAKAEREHKLLFTWVNGDPVDTIVKAFPGAIHVQVPDNRGDKTPKLIFPGHDGDYYIPRSGIGASSPDQIRRLRQPLPSDTIVVPGGPANCPNGQCVRPSR